MIQKILVFLLLLFIATPNQAQTCIGANKFVSGVGPNKWIRADYAPYLVVGGVYYGTSTTIGGQSLLADSGNAATVYAAVLDTSFNVIRMFNVIGLRTYGGVVPTRLWDMHVDKKGNIYFCGSYTQDTLISGNDTVISADGYIEAFVVSVDTYGNSRFLKSCGTRTANASHGYEDRATAVTTDGAGNVYFVVNGQGTYFELDSLTVNAQQFSPLNGYYDVFTVSLDSLGKVRWMRNCGTPNKDDSAFDIAADSVGNVSITGTENGSNSVFNFGAFSHTFIYNTNGYHGFVARYDNAGNEQWLQSIETYYPSGPDVGPYAIVVDDVGNTYAGGYFDGYVIFGADTIRTLNSTSNYLAKYNSTGQLKYLKTGKIDAFYPYPMEMDLNKDKILITGQTFTNQLLFGQFGACCSNRSYIVQYDTSGTVDWLRAVSTTGTGTGINYSCALGPNNEAYVSGYARDAVLTLYPNTLSGSSTGSYYVARIGTIANSPFTFSIALNGNDTLACGVNAQIVSTSSVGTNAQITWWADKDTIALPNFYTSISATPRVSSTYIATATYNGCSIRDTVSIHVIALPVNAGNDTVICANTLLQLKTDSIPSATYSWKPSSFFNNSTLYNPYFLGISSTPVIVSVKKNGCASYDTVAITVNPLPASNFSFTAVNYTVDFSASNLFANSFYWDFGDGTGDSVIQNPMHQYDSSLVYNVCLYSFNDCGQDSICQTVNLSNVKVNDIESNQVTAHYSNELQAMQLSNLSFADKTIYIADIFGRSIAKLQTNNTSVSLNTANFRQGIYTCIVYANSQKLLHYKFVKF